MTAQGKDIEHILRTTATSGAQSPLEKGEAISQNPNSPETGTLKKIWKTFILHFFTWWFLLCHILICTALCVVMVLYLDGYMALDDASGSLMDYVDYVRSGLKNHLRVGDITTIISAVLVVNKLLVSGWTAVTIWRCAYNLMEKGGIEGAAISRMLTWKVPFHKPVGRVGWTVALVLLFLVPQPLVGPLITGSVGWSTAVVFRSRHETVFTSERPPEALEARIVEHLNLTASHDEENSGADWTFLVMDTARNIDANTTLSNIGNGRLRLSRYIALRGGAMAGMLWDPDGIQHVENSTSVAAPGWYRNPCRQRTALHEDPHRVTVRSKTTNVKMPCIMVEDITWTPLPDELLNNTILDIYANMSMFGTNNLLYSIIPGVAVLFDPSTPELKDLWNSSASNGTGFITLPEPEIMSETLTLLVLLDLDVHGCDLAAGHNTWSIFGSLANSGIQQSAVKHEEKLWCLAYAKVRITAGMVAFKEAEFVTNTVFEGKRDTAISRRDFLPNRWVRPSVMMLPDIMRQVAITNMTQIPTWNNLNGYIESLIVQSYLGTWGVIQAMDSVHETIQVQVAEKRLKAKVSQWRVWTWFAVNMLVPLSGIVWYFGAQLSCKGKIILDAPLTALLTDVSEVLLAIEEKTKDGKLDRTQIINEIGRLKLKWDPESETYKLAVKSPKPGDADHRQDVAGNGHGQN